MQGPVILIFGAAVQADGQPSPTLRRRVEAAARFGMGLEGAYYMPTGAVGRHGPAEAEVMAALLHGHGVDPGRILLEPTGTDTLSSVRACVARLRVLGHDGPAWACTSGFHLPRCVMLLRLAGLRARACPPPSVPDTVGAGARWYWRAREAAAVPVDLALILALRLGGRLR